ncbi:hypothetical protein FRC02_005625 [Tulasnella sp. 418]|nr:hypothetical protein FRC02_005625 [Tulasnella sp. 418]
MVRFRVRFGFSRFGEPDSGITTHINEPFQSRFHLVDQPLHLSDIIQAHLPSAELAFLAACHSAAGDNKTPDEFIHLAAGLQFSGFKSVIGTLYKMPDTDGPTIAEEVYKYMFRRVRGENGDGILVDYRDAAVALNRATRVLKEKGFSIDSWINFVHIGA